MSLVLGIWTGWDRTASGAGFLCWLQEEYKDLVQSRCVHFGQLTEDVMIILTISDKFALEMTWPMLVGREILSATRRWAQPWSNRSARSWVFWPNPGKAQGQQSVPWTEVKQDEMGWLQGQEGRKQTENRLKTELGQIPSAAGAVVSEPTSPPLKGGQRCFLMLAVCCEDQVKKKWLLHFAKLPVSPVIGVLEKPHGELFTFCSVQRFGAVWRIRSQLSHTPRVEK